MTNKYALARESTASHTPLSTHGDSRYSDDQRDRSHRLHAPILLPFAKCQAVAGLISHLYESCSVVWHPLGHFGPRPPKVSERLPGYFCITGSLLACALLLSAAMSELVELPARMRRKAYCDG